MGGSSLAHYPRVLARRKQFSELVVEPVITSLIQAEQERDNLVEWGKYGSYDIRIIAWVMRYIKNLWQKATEATVILDLVLKINEIKEN